MCVWQELWRWDTKKSKVEDRHVWTRIQQVPSQTARVICQLTTGGHEPHKFWQLGAQISILYHFEWLGVTKTQGFFWTCPDDHPGMHRPWRHQEIIRPCLPSSCTWLTDWWKLAQCRRTWPAWWLAVGFQPEIFFKDAILVGSLQNLLPLPPSCVVF